LLEIEYGSSSILGYIRLNLRIFDLEQNYVCKLVLVFFLEKICGFLPHFERIN